MEEGRDQIAPTLTVCPTGPKQRVANLTEHPEWLTPGMFSKSKGNILLSLHSWLVENTPATPS